MHVRCASLTDKKTVFLFFQKQNQCKIYVIWLIWLDNQHGQHHRSRPLNLLKCWSRWACSWFISLWFHVGRGGETIFSLELTDCTCTIGAATVSNGYAHRKFKTQHHQFPQSTMIRIAILVLFDIVNILLENHLKPVSMQWFNRNVWALMLHSRIIYIHACF